MVETVHVDDRLTLLLLLLMLIQADQSISQDQPQEQQPSSSSTALPPIPIHTKVEDAASPALPPVPPTLDQGGDIKPAAPSNSIFSPTSTSAPSQPPQQQQPIQPAPPPLPQGMPKEQTKYALAMLRTLKKKAEAAPFLQPVDPVALGIPTYPDIVKKPMDLSTVERKVTNGTYKNVDEFSSDIRLIWQNAYTFNGSENPVSKMGNTLSTLFEKQLLKMPTLASIQAAQAAALAKRSESPTMEKKAKAPAPAGGAAAPAPKKKATNAQGGAAGPSKAAVKKEQQNQQQMQHPHQQGGIPMSGVPMQGMQGMQGMMPGPMPGQDGKPPPKKGKKAQQAAMQQQQQQAQGMFGMQGGMGGMMGMQQQGPTPQQQAQQHQQMVQQLLNQEQVKFCLDVIRELFKKQHSAFAYPFYEPVGECLRQIIDKTHSHADLLYCLLVLV